MFNRKKFKTTQGFSVWVHKPPPRTYNVLGQRYIRASTVINSVLLFSFVFFVLGAYAMHFVERNGYFKQVNRLVIAGASAEKKAQPAKALPAPPKNTIALPVVTVPEEVRMSSEVPSLTANETIVDITKDAPNLSIQKKK